MAGKHTREGQTTPFQVAWSATRLCRAYSTSRLTRKKPPTLQRRIPPSQSSSLQCFKDFSHTATSPRSMRRHLQSTRRYPPGSGRVMLARATGMLRRRHHRRHHPRPRDHHRPDPQCRLFRAPIARLRRTCTILTEIPTSLIVRWTTRRCAAGFAARRRAASSLPSTQQRRNALSKMRSRRQCRRMGSSAGRVTNLKSLVVTFQ
mmetsp:Transcript_30812/g.80632  ORF Transcript_30812/g.80632 Transcript_30812/m.80632 type:complete len:204 (+) Transcript_30812:1147-1758(+)